MKPYKTLAHINSLNGEMREITVLEQHPTQPNSYIVQYEDVKCTAILNWFTCEYYADDKYGAIKDR